MGRSRISSVPREDRQLSHDSNAASLKPQARQPQAGQQILPAHGVSLGVLRHRVQLFMADLSSRPIVRLGIRLGQCRCGHHQHSVKLCDYDDVRELVEWMYDNQLSVSSAPRLTCYNGYLIRKWQFARLCHNQAAVGVQTIQLIRDSAPELADAARWNGRGYRN